MYVRITVLAVLTGLSLFGQSTADSANTDPKPAPKTAAKKTAAKTAAPKTPVVPVAQPLEIPKDAVANADGTYNYTDKQGKKWRYVKTPFGVSRTQVDDFEAPAAPASDKYIKATDAGDSVRFERATPFGTQTWTRKKTELTEDEKRIVAAQTPQQQ